MDMSKFTEYERLQGCCRLEVGCLNFANMFKDDDLVKTFANLKFLTCLKLMWCHLLRSDGFALSIGLPGAVRLQELRMHQCAVDGASIVAACPNLTSLGLSNCEVTGGAHFAKLKLKRVMSFLSGSIAWVKQCTTLTHVWVHVSREDRAALAKCWPNLRVFVGNDAGHAAHLMKIAIPAMPPLVDYYETNDLLRGSHSSNFGQLDWELLPK